MKRMKVTHEQALEIEFGRAVVHIAELTARLTQAGYRVRLFQSIEDQNDFTAEIGKRTNIPQQRRQVAKANAEKEKQKDKKPC